MYIVVFLLFFNLFCFLFSNTIINSTYKCKLFSVLIVYVICGKSKFSIHLSQYPVYELRCNNRTNYKDMYEAGLMLDFIIKIYKKPMAEKYIFCQGHDKSHHYNINFWDRVKYITSSAYFEKNNFGGLYCIYNRCYQTNEHMNSWTYGVEPFLKKENFLNHYISDANILTPCCATFFVSHSLINNNKISLYILLRKSLTKFVENNLNIIINRLTSNKRAAVYMEFYWGVLFSKPNTTVAIPPDCYGKMKIWK